MTNLEYCNEILSIIGNVSEANDAIYNLAYDAYLKLGGQESQPTLATIYNELKQAIRIWDETGSLSITENGTYNLLGKSISVSVAGDGIPNDEIWYTTTDGNIIRNPHPDAGLPTVISNTYSNGKGVIKFANSFSSIGIYGFYQRLNLSSMYIHNNVTSIGFQCFQLCKNLTAFIFPDNISFIDKEAFKNSGLTSVIIPPNISTISNSAFYGCNNLSYVTISNGVTRFDNSAFAGNNNLTAITYTGTKAQWNNISKASNWKLDSPITVIHCSDGDVNI